MAKAKTGGKVDALRATREAEAAQAESQAKARRKELTLHPACEALPVLPKARYDELVESIRANGLEDPIVTHNGEVLDGRHRLRACEEAGVEPRFVEWDGRGGDPVGFIALKQIRRDMTKSQRAAWAAEYVLPAEEEKARERQASHGAAPGRVANTSGSGSTSDAGTARDKAGEATGVSGRSVDTAKKVKDADEALFEDLKSGKKTLAQAAREAALTERLRGFPDDERERAAAFLHHVVAEGNHSSTAVELADKLLAKPAEDRLRIYVFHESDDPRERSLALTEAANLPPMPHPALPHLRDAGRAIAKARRHFNGDASGERLKVVRSEIDAVISTLQEGAA
jgi:hypothetical protein